MEGHAFCHSAGEDAGVMLAMLRAKACDESPAESEVLAFCEELKGHT